MSIMRPVAVLVLSIIAAPLTQATGTAHPVFRQPSQCPAPDRTVVTALESALHVPTDEYDELLRRLAETSARAAQQSNILLFDSTAILQAQLDDLRLAEAPRLDGTVIVEAQEVEVEAHVIAAWLRNREGQLVADRPALWVSIDEGRMGYSLNDVAAQASILENVRVARRDLRISQTDPGVRAALACLTR